MATAAYDDGGNDKWLPEKPQKPLPSDCCGTGCSPCVNDIYEREMEKWSELQRMSIEERERVWRGKQEAQSETEKALSPEEYSRFELISFIPVSRDSSLCSFKLPQNQILGMKVGQHAIMRLKDNEGKYIARQYTPVSPLNQKDHFEVLIKLYSDGQLSTIIGATFKPGCLVDWKGPFGEFQYSPNQFKELVMLACGTGIAPMIQVIRAVLENENDFTKLRLLYASKTQHDILLKNLINEFSDYWNFSVTYFLSSCNEEKLSLDKGQVCYGDCVKFGRIDQSILESELRSSESMQFLICGTKSFDKDMIKYLLKLNFNYEQIFKF